MNGSKKKLDPNLVRNNNHTNNLITINKMLHIINSTLSNYCSTIVNISYTSRETAYLKFQSHSGSDVNDV